MSGLASGVIVGVGPGLGAALARRFAQGGVRLLLAAREIGRLERLCAETGAEALSCDATDVTLVESLFRSVDARFGTLDLCIYNAGLRLRGPFTELTPESAQQAFAVNAYGAFLVAREAARRMVPRGRGCLLFTGATAGLKGFAGSAPFAMGKFALRGLAQSLARELHPKGVHVAHIVIDGVIRRPGQTEAGEGAERLLEPEAIAETFWHVANQPRSSWTDELVLRPWSEPF